MPTDLKISQLTFRVSLLGNELVALAVIEGSPAAGANYNVTVEDIAQYMRVTTPGIGVGCAVNYHNAAYTAVLTDKNTGFVHQAADTTSRTWTIPAAASVNFDIGTLLTFDNEFGAGIITIAIGGSDTLELVGSGATGSRFIASGGQATAWKVGNTKWRISGVGLT